MIHELVNGFGRTCTNYPHPCMMVSHWASQLLALRTRSVLDEDLGKCPLIQTAPCWTGQYWALFQEWVDDSLEGKGWGAIWKTYIEEGSEQIVFTAQELKSHFYVKLEDPHIEESRYSGGDYSNGSFNVPLNQATVHGCCPLAQIAHSKLVWYLLTVLPSQVI
jgi:hypothetical protein